MHVLKHEKLVKSKLFMRRILPLVALLFYSLQLLSQGIGFGCPETIDQQNTIINTGSQGIDQFQTFTAGSNGSLTGIDFQTNSCPSYTYVLTIYSGAGTGGTVLFSGTFTNSGMCNNWQPSNIALASAPVLSNGNVYTLRLQSTTNMFTTVSNTSLYGGGYYYSNSYGTPAGWDLNFRTRMQTSTAYPPNTITASGALTVCAGGNTTLSASGGGFSFQWYNVGGAIAGATGINYTAPAGNSYAVVKTNTANGCFATSNTLVVTASAITSTNVSYSVCPGNSIALTSIPSGTASWNTGATSLSIAVSPTVFTSYTVQAGVPLGCITRTISDVFVNKAPVLDVNGLTATVNLGSMQTNNSDWSTIYYPFTDPLPANARITGYEFDYDVVDQAWGGSGCGLGTQVSGEPAGGTIVLATLTHTNYFAASAGSTYTLGGTNSVGINFCGWSGWQAFLTNVKLIIHYDLPTQSICFGQTATLTATGASTYTWSPAITNGAAFSPTTTAVYTVSGTSSNGCLASKVVTMQVRPVPTLTVTGTATTCVGGTITQVVSGGNTYTWSTGNTSTTQTFSPNGIVNYTISSTNTISACSVNSVYAVNGLPRPSISVPNYTICNGGTATLVPTGALTYTFSSGNNTVSPISTTSYSISGTSTAGCTSTAVAVSSVIVNALPALTAGGISAICLGKSTTLTAGSADTYSWSTGATSASVVLSPTSTTQYSVTGTNTTTSCKATSILNVTVNPLPPVAAAGGTICAGRSFTFSPSGGISYTYSSGSSIVSPTTTTNYTITGSNANSCTNSAVSSVVVFTVPNIAASSGTMCFGTNYIVNPTGAISYTINDATTNTITVGSVTLTPTVTTTYTISGNSINGCRSVTDAVITVTVHNLPTISAASQTMCAGQTITFSPIGAATYTWLPAGPIVSPAATTSYTLSGTSSLGCTNIAVIAPAVTVYSLPIVAISGGSICSGNTFTFGPTGALSYVFIPSGPTVTPASTTQYSVFGTSALGCSNTLAAIATVSVFATPSLTVNSGSICSGNVFTITPTGASTYVFSAPGTATVSPLSNTQYSVSGTSTAGCTSTAVAVAQVTVNPRPNISVNSGTLCQGMTFTLIPSGASTYNFSNGSNTVNPMSTTSYSVSGTSSLGCSSTSLAISTVTVFNTPTITVNSGSICSGQVFTVVPNGAASYVISGGSFTVNPIVTTSYSVTGTSSAGCGSSVTAISSVSVETTPTISAPSGTICVGNSFTLQPSGATTYSIAGGNSVVSPTSTTNYQIIGYSPNACASAPISPTVLVNNLPTVTAVFNPSVVCIGFSVLPVASGAQTYNWSSNITNNTPRNFSVSGTHTVEGTDANGCSNSATVGVVVNNLPVLNVASNNSVSCEAETVTLTATGAASYTWSTASVTGSIVQSPTATTLYTVTGTDANTCVNSVVFSQSVVPCAETFNAFPTITDVECEGKKNGRIVISASAGYSNKSFNYVWSNPGLCSGIECGTVDSLDEGIYSVKVIMTYTLNGFFVKKDSLVVGPLKIEDKNGPCSVTIFQGITANSDGQNDHLFVENLQLYPKNKVTIFNRWGNVVAEISGYDNVENVWPRADENDKLQASTYFYIIDLGEGGKPIKGWIEIIKN